MAEKVYVLTRVRPRETWWQLSEKERKSLVGKAVKACEDAGAKSLAGFSACSSEWGDIYVDVYPDMEAYHKYRMAIQELNVQRYWDYDITLGFEPPA